jgi:hypothetical protein
MPRILLDSDTADRMLSGAVDPRDVPPGYGRVAELLQVLAAPPSPVADAAHPRAAGRPVVAALAARVRTSTVAVAAALCLATGTAAYAAGLPQAASHTASGILSKLGLPTGAARSHPANHGADVSAVAHRHGDTGRAHGAAVSAVARSKRHGRGSHRSHDPGAGGRAGAAGKGKHISALAHATGTTGGKGRVVSPAASGGTSHAGLEGQGTDMSSSASANGGSRQTSHGGHTGGSGTTAR